MKKAPAYSLDTLALENAEHVKMCKFLTAQILAEKINGCLVEKDPRGFLCWKEWDFLMRELSGDGGSSGNKNWLHLL